MANIFDFLNPWRSPRSPWDKPRFRPEPNRHRKPPRRRSLPERFALVLGFFVLGAGIAAAALNYDRLPELAAYLRGDPAASPAALDRIPTPHPRYSEPVRPAPGQSGRFTADDGDSLRAGSERIRLLGIDAPELFQTCRDGAGREWPCGRAAHERLRGLLAGGEVRCAPHGQDRYGRTLARCSAGPVADIGEAMIREGLAVDFMGGGYGRAEAEARAARRGIWSGKSDRPQEWRRQNPRRERAD